MTSRDPLTVAFVPVRGKFMLQFAKLLKRLALNTVTDLLCQTHINSSINGMPIRGIHADVIVYILAH